MCDSVDVSFSNLYGILLNHIPKTTLSSVYGIIYVAAMVFYAYHKCPGVWRVTSFLVLFSWVAWMLPDLDPQCDASRHIKFISCWISVLRYSSIKIILLFIFAATTFVRANWCKKINLVRDITSVGFDHLDEVAKRKGKSKTEVIAEYLPRRDYGRLRSGYPNGWFALLESRDLKRGQTKPVFALGKAFALFRGEDGVAYILNAVCPHLGANLAVDGKVKGNCLECPFHKWQFDGKTGNCTKIPYIASAPPLGIRTRTWLCKELYGFIYTWYHAEGLDPTWEIVSLPEIKTGTFIYKGRTEHIVNTSLQAIAENIADAPHLDQIHSDSVLFSRKGYMQHLIDIKHRWTDVQWKKYDEERRSHMTEMTLKSHTEFFGHRIPFSNADVKNYNVGPAMVYGRVSSAAGKGIYLANAIPETPLQIRVIHHFYAELGYWQWAANSFLSGDANMIERDIVIWNNQKYLHNGRFIAADENIRRFRRWFSMFYSENFEESLDW